MAVATGSLQTACRRSEVIPSVDPRGAEPLVARRVDFEQVLALTGEIDATASVEYRVPRVPEGRVTLRFLVAEGLQVKTGDTIAEFDSTQFVQEIRDESLQLSQAEIDLERQRSQNGVAEADSEMEVEHLRAIVLRAEVDADVPEGILPQRDFLEKKLVLERAKVDLARAEEALSALRKGNAADLEIKRVALEKRRRSVGLARESIKDLTLRATSPGTVLLGDHDDEPRKLQEGDIVRLGELVARVTASDARRVKALLPDVDDGKVEVGMFARVIVDAHPKRVFAGKITELSPIAHQAGNRRSQRKAFTVLVGLEATDDLLIPGLSARVEVVTGKQTGVLQAPRMALRRAGERTRVGLEGGEEVDVDLGACNGQVCVVEKGLDEGARLEAAP